MRINSIGIEGKHMIEGTARIALASAIAMAAGACVRIAPQAAFQPVAMDVESRIGARVQWDLGTDDDLAARAAIGSMLARPLTPASAVQIALLNNRELQAAYAEVGIAQANLVQAGLLRNPVFDGAVTWFTDAGGAPNLAFGVAWSFVDLLQRPRRKAVAESALQEAQLQVARRVIVHAADTHAAFVAHVATTQEADLMQGVVKAARASADAAAELRKAGNLTERQFEQNRSFLTTAKLELAQAEARENETRERLNILMGLTGPQTAWSAPRKLPAGPGNLPGLRHAERRAVEASIEIATARQKLVTLGRQLRLVRKQSLIPDLEAGGEYEREIDVEEADGGGTERDARTAYGPAFEVQIPIFDHGQARKAGAALRIEQAEDELWALAVRVRSTARLARARLITARDTEAYYRQALLPQADRLLQGAQRDYNAMQAGVFELIAAKRQQIDMGREHIQAQRALWIAHVRFQQLMSGALPEGEDMESMEVASAGAEGGGGH